MRTSLTEPFTLTRRARETFADWFDQNEVRVSSLSLDSISSLSRISHLAHADVAEAHDLVVVRGAGELRPAIAGAMAGAAAGPAMMAIATVLAQRSHRAIDLPGLLGNVVARGAGWSHAAGWTLAVVVGAILGSVYALFTRRLRSFAPMIAFGVVTSFAVWTTLHALALPRVAPWLAKMLPFGPMVIGSMAFGSLLALQVPIRTRRLV